MKNLLTFIFCFLFALSISAQCEYLEGDMEVFLDLTSDIDESGMIEANTLVLPQNHVSPVRLLFLAFDLAFEEIGSPAYLQFLSYGLGISQSDDAYSGNSAVKLQPDEYVNLVDLVNITSCDELPTMLNLSYKHVGDGFDTLVIYSVFSDSLFSIFDEEFVFEEQSGFIEREIYSQGTDDEYTTISIPYVNNGLGVFADTLTTVFAAIGDPNIINAGEDSYFLLDFVYLGDPLVSNEEVEITNHIFPNPTESTIQISAETPVSFSITDLAGKVIISNDNFSEDHLFDMSNFTNGAYLIRLKNREGNFSIEKIIKQ